MLFRLALQYRSFGMDAVAAWTQLRHGRVPQLRHQRSCEGRCQRVASEGTPCAVGFLLPATARWGDMRAVLAVKLAKKVFVMQCHVMICDGGDVGWWIWDGGDVVICHVIN